MNVWQVKALLWFTLCFRVIVQNHSTKNATVLLRAYKTWNSPLLEHVTVVFNPQHVLLSCGTIIQNSLTKKLMTWIMAFLYDAILVVKKNPNFGLHCLFSRRWKFDLMIFHEIIHGCGGLRRIQCVEMRISKHPNQGTIQKNSHSWLNPALGINSL